MGSLRRQCRKFHFVGIPVKCIGLVIHRGFLTICHQKRPIERQHGSLIACISARDIACTLVYWVLVINSISFSLKLRVTLTDFVQRAGRNFHLRESNFCKSLIAHAVYGALISNPNRLSIHFVSCLPVGANTSWILSTINRKWHRLTRLTNEIVTWSNNFRNKRVAKLLDHHVAFLPWPRDV